MPEMAGFRCKVCHHGFPMEVLTPREAEDLRRQNRRGGNIICPRCSSPDVERVSN
jgi:transposase-like protein